jgi:hypothetical protein
MKISYDKNEMKITNALWLYYISKGIELFDTIFMIIRKRFTQITFLHVFHHSSMFFFWWVVLTWVPVRSSIDFRLKFILFQSGQAWFGPFMNSIVHILMYSYYGLSVIPALRGKLWWKRYITIIQLVNKKIED